MRRHVRFSTDPELDEFLTEFQQETPRAAPGSARAFLDDKVKHLLLASTVDESKYCAALIDGFEAPLGTFSARIKGAFAIGLITEEERFDLDQIRDIWQRVRTQAPRPHIRGRIYPRQVQVTEMRWRGDEPSQGVPEVLSVERSGAFRLWYCPSCHLFESSNCQC